MSDKKHKVLRLQKRKKSGRCRRTVFLEQNSKLINVQCPYSIVLFIPYLPTFLHTSSCYKLTFLQYPVLHTVQQHSRLVPISVRLVLDPSNVSHPRSLI